MGFGEMEDKLEREDGCGRKIEVDIFLMWTLRGRVTSAEEITLVH